MGYMIHNAIVITSWSQPLAEEAATYARRLGMQVLGPSEPLNPNGYCSVLICPDGSKDGWDESTLGGNRRTILRQWLMNQVAEDGGTSFEWAEIEYGSDDETAKIVAHPWAQIAE